MSEVARCPVCGKEPSRTKDWIRCCGHKIESLYEFMNIDRWNQYAAAMELAKAYAAFNKEKDPIKANELWPATKQAEKRVLEVFNG